MGPNAFPNGQPFPFLTGTTWTDEDIGTANYNSLQVKLDRRVSQGLRLLASYTYSKCLDEDSGEWAEQVQETYDRMADYGPCDYNFPQLLNFSYSYQLPFGAGRHFAQNGGRAAEALIGGWNISGITSAFSGSPFQVTLPFDNANSGNGYQRANVVPGCQLKPAGFQQTIYNWYNPDCFAMPAPYTFGNLARNTLRGPDSWNLDFSLFKDFNLTESKKLQFRAEFFNILNHANLSPPGGTPGGSVSAQGGPSETLIETPTFMEILGAAPAREIQFALKLIF